MEKGNREVVKIAFRSDRKANLLRVYLASLDESRMDEIARINLSVVQLEGVFDQIKEAFKLALYQLSSKVLGVTVVGFDEVKPRDKN